MRELKRAFRLFWAWEDEKEERWLEEMARDGWRLVSGPVMYKFERSAPAEVRYRLDYPPQDKNLQDYVRLCNDAGWERVLQFSGWQYFRTSRADAPEIYTDKASRIAKYQRLLAVCLLLALCTMLPNLISVTNESPGSPAHHAVIGSLRWIVLVLGVLWIYLLARLWAHIQRLKKTTEGKLTDKSLPLI
jgi:Protein of unknown function (DUF2812).